MWLMALARSWLRDSLASCGQPSVEFSHQRCAQFATHGEPLGGILAIDAALDIEQSIDPLHGLERDR